MKTVVFSNPNAAQTHTNETRIGLSELQ